MYQCVRFFFFHGLGAVSRVWINFCIDYCWFEEFAWEEKHLAWRWWEFR